MKKNFFALLFLCAVLLLSFVFVGCNKNRNNAVTFYCDDNDIEIDGVSVKVSVSETYASYGSNSENKNVTVTLVLNNGKTQDVQFSFDNLKFVSETTNVVYDQVYMTNPISITKAFALKYGIDSTFSFQATLPTSYKNDNYVFCFKNGKEYIIKLYETPDELREDVVVDFCVDSQNVNQITVKKGRAISNNYIWESKDHLSYCEKWFLDSSYKNEFSFGTKISVGITLYGRTSNNLSASYENGYGYYVKKIDHVNKDGILIVPNYDGAKIYISNFAICNNSNVREIYLPANIKRIYSGNFDKMVNLTKIHFAGSQSEWESIETSSSISSSVIMAFNSFYI